MATSEIPREKRRALLRALEDAFCATGPPGDPPTGFENGSGNMDPENAVIFDPESAVIFDPESAVIFDPGKSLNPDDGISIEHFSGNIYDSYGNKINKLDSLCDLMRLLHWLLRYDDLINPVPPTGT